MEVFVYEKTTPPGVCTLPGSHGPQSPIRRRMTGIERLRAVMHLSADASVEQICDDAARELAELRGFDELDAEADAEPVIIKRKRGRPPTKHRFAEL